jgi:hypothetical protein
MIGRDEPKIQKVRALGCKDGVCYVGDEGVKG